MLPLATPVAVIEFSFDPIAAIGDVAVRFETLGVAAAILVSMIVAALVARRTPIDVASPSDAPGDEPDEPNHLRADDLLYIAVAAVPGAVIGARLGYALIHLDFYRSNAGALLDIGQGGFQLSLGVVGGILTASIVAAMLGAPLGRWLHALVLPMLLLLALGKTSMVLGGSGQGQLTEASWATAYVSPGPWGSLAPALPAHPSQAYEALATVVVILVVMWFLALDAFRGRNGGALLLGLGLWAIARCLVAASWRDPTVIGPLRMDQVISIAIAIASFGLMAAIGGVSVVRGRRARAAGDAPGAVPVAGATPAGSAGVVGSTVTVTAGEAAGDSAPAWPDPESRPRI